LLHVGTENEFLSTDLDVKARKRLNQPNTLLVKHTKIITGKNSTRFAHATFALIKVKAISTTFILIN